MFVGTEGRLIPGVGLGGGLNETLNEMHITPPIDTLNTERSNERFENVVIDIIGQKSLQNDLK